MIEGLVRIAVVGDIALTHDYESLCSKHGPHFPFSLIQKKFKEHDVVIGNLEAPFCVEGETYPMKCSLKAHPDYISGIKEAGFHILTLANNHILDYQETCLDETMGLLYENGIRFCGAGSNLSEARKPVILKKNGISLGILARCDVIIESPFYANETVRGISPLDVCALEQDIDALKEDVDVVIVSLHWGIENWHYPSCKQVDIAHRIIDSGADLVVGHHPHVLQGVEQYKDGLIVYSLGNFLFSDISWTWTDTKGANRNSVVRLASENRRTMMLSLTIDRKGVRDFHPVPCRIDCDLRTVPITDSIIFRGKMWLLSKPIMMQKYPLFWAWYDRCANMHSILATNFKRLRKIHRFRSRHVFELMGIIRNMFPGSRQS